VEKITPGISRWVSEFFIYKQRQTPLNPTRESSGGIVGLREGRGRVLCTLLRRNFFPSFSNGQNTGRPHYQSPTFAIALPPVFFHPSRGGWGSSPQLWGGFLGWFTPFALGHGSEPRRSPHASWGAAPGARVGVVEEENLLDAEIATGGLQKSRLDFAAVAVNAKGGCPRLHAPRHRSGAGRGRGTRSPGQGKAFNVRCSSRPPDEAGLRQSSQDVLRLVPRVTMSVGAPSLFYSFFLKEPGNSSYFPSASAVQKNSSGELSCKPAGTVTRSPWNFVFFWPNTFFWPASHRPRDPPQPVPPPDPSPCTRWVSWCSGEGAEHGGSPLPSPLAGADVVIKSR